MAGAPGAASRDELVKKVAALTAINAALQSENEQLRRRAEDAGDAELATEVAELQEEFESRLATAEKTIIILKSERESLLRRLEAASKAADTHQRELDDKDAALLALRAEGEALSRKQSELEGALRKLRASLRECEAERDALSAKVHELERDAENGQLAVQASTEEIQSEVQRVTVLARERERALQVTIQAQSDRITSLQATLAAMETRTAAREDTLRAEVASLERKCQDAEAARDELAASHTEATLPLLRELEAANAAVARTNDLAAEMESRLLMRVQAAEAALLHAETGERSARAHASAAESASKHAAASAAALTEELAASNARLDALMAEIADGQRQLQDESTSRHAAEEARLKAEAHAAALQVERDRLAKALPEAQNAWLVRERELLSQISELQATLTHTAQASAACDTALREGEPGAASAPGAPALDEAGAVDRHERGTVRQGELSELRRRLQAVEAARKLDAQMLLDAEQRAVALASAAAECAAVRRQLADLELQHATALELLGERNERVDELQQDLLEAREIYRSQLLMLCPLSSEDRPR